MTIKKTPSVFSPSQRWRSIGFAVAGLITLWRSQANARFHLAVALLVVVAGLLASLTVGEWMMITFSIGFVMTLEAVNTAIEFLADRVTKEHDEQIKKVKDVAAAAVLLASITAVIQGALIFTPHLWGLL
ncbi:Undecaprenol kinase [Sinobacterium norvegicum]|uniref:Undecaprenol kinase n=1 Tax=Sinobacterium norvegicum TaxID=1641715 RepID=A0ABM9AHB8_9GAMM|nr:diacylglycerol kinase family protein [Sinobacterium norvegicum]CAH0992590.1 Undecaprenol kinase [Sinobacterium norvegicum]